MAAWCRRIAIGCAMKGLLARVVKTRAEKRAPGFRARWTAASASPGDGSSISPNRQIDASKGSASVQVVRRAFERLDIPHACAGGVSAHMLQHGGRYVAGNDSAGRTHAFCRLDALAAGTAGQVDNPHPRPDSRHVDERSVAPERLTANHAPTSPSRALPTPMWCEARISMCRRPFTAPHERMPAHQSIAGARRDETARSLVLNTSGMLGQVEFPLAAAVDGR